MKNLGLDLVKSYFIVPSLLVRIKAALDFCVTIFSEVSRSVINSWIKCALHFTYSISTWLRVQYYFGNFMPFSRKIQNLRKETSVQLLNAIVVKSTVSSSWCFWWVWAKKCCYRFSHKPIVQTLAISKLSFYLHSCQKR